MIRDGLVSLACVCAAMVGMFYAGQDCERESAARKELARLDAELAKVDAAMDRARQEEEGIKLSVRGIAYTPRVVTEDCWVWADRRWRIDGCGDLEYGVRTYYPTWFHLLLQREGLPLGVYGAVQMDAHRWLSWGSLDALKGAMGVGP
jgi:hypothetical protein